MINILSKTFLSQERSAHAHFYFPDRGAFEGRTSIWQDFRGNFNGRKFKSSEIESDNTIICRLFLLIARQCWRWFMRWAFDCWLFKSTKRHFFQVESILSFFTHSINLFYLRSSNLTLTLLMWRQSSPKLSSPWKMLSSKSTFLRSKPSTCASVKLAPISGFVWWTPICLMPRRKISKPMLKLQLPSKMERWDQIQIFLELSSWFTQF